MSFKLIVILGFALLSQACGGGGGGGGGGGAGTSPVAPDGAFSIANVDDPLAQQQWHLKNTGQKAYADSAGVTGMDINVDSVYGLDFDGRGVLVAVVDTGLEIAHEDLTSNVVADGSWNFLNSSTNPTNTATDGDHGTSVAGLIAMTRNTIGGIGVAPAAQLKGFNLLASSQSTTIKVDSLGGSSSNPKSDDVFIFNQSYGGVNSTASASSSIRFIDDSQINSTLYAQYQTGTTNLRSGKGALYVKSAGNGFVSQPTGKVNNIQTKAFCDHAIAAGVSCANANFDSSNSIPYQVVVGATNASGIKSSYSTAGSALWVSAPGGEGGYNTSVIPGLISAAYKPAMVTTDQSNCSTGYAKTDINTSAFANGGSPNTACNYTNEFNGTSSAAPVTSGVIALMLEANPLLTWRDVKHILASTSRKIDDSRAAVSVTLSNGSYVAEPTWTTNAAGFDFHNWYGFGMIDATAAVNMARNSYTNLNSFASTSLLSSGTISQVIPDDSVTGTSNTINVSSSGLVEAVQVTVSAIHGFTGDLSIELTSPLGTRSVLKNGRDGFSGSNNLSSMVLLTNAFYGETISGNWTIKIIDTEDSSIFQVGDTGFLIGWKIQVFGRNS